MSNRVQVIDVNYAPQDGRLRLDLVGHPSECIDKALATADALLNNWVFVSIDGRRQSGASLPSDFSMKIVIEREMG